MTYAVENAVENRSRAFGPIRRAIAVLIAVFAFGCDRSTTILPIVQPSPIPSSPTTPPVSTVDLVEFRVVGTVPLATVRVDNSIDGFTQTTSVLPFSSTVSLGGRDNVFLSLDARSAFVGSSGSILHAAIFVNGIVFRESSSDAFSPVVQVSGTWRRAK